jgi:aminopeptidase C
MKKQVLVFLSALLLTVFYSCNKTDDPTENNIDNAIDNAMDNEKSVEKEKAEKEFNTRTIKVTFPEGINNITLYEYINGFGDKIVYEFDAMEGQILYAFVYTKIGKGNVVINQIVTPGGIADGPFGERITYLLKESGKWKLIIGEDMMAGEPWKGDYSLQFEIK